MLTSRLLIPTLTGLLALANTGAFAEDVSNQPRNDKPTPVTASGENKGTHSWELPALVVQGKSGGDVREEDRIGTYGQPRWTARRRFAETRVYVIPEGQIQFEYWNIVKDASKRDIDDAKAVGAERPKATIKNVYEVEIGLPYRFQLDLYQVYKKDGTNGSGGLDELKFELRWAFADWDVIWGNPTVYLEWAQPQDGADHVEVKLLLGGEMAQRWHWGTNFVFERETGNAMEHAYEMTNGVSYTLTDERFSVGLEDKFAISNERIDPAQSERTSFRNEFLLGPTIQYRPLPQMHVNLAVLAGLNKDAPQYKTVLVAGWEF